MLKIKSKKIIICSAILSVFLLAILVYAASIDITTCKSGTTDWSCNSDKTCACTISGTCTNGFLLVYKDTISNLLCSPTISGTSASINWNACGNPTGSVGARADCDQGQSVDKTINIVQATTTTSSTTTSTSTTTTHPTTTSSSTTTSTSTSSTTTTTVPQNPQYKFNSTYFNTTNTTSGHNITLSYNNSLQENALVLFMVIDKEGLVVYYSNKTVSVGLGATTGQINCTSLGPGDYKVLWEAYLGLDSKLLNIRAWAKPDKWIGVNCK